MSELSKTPLFQQHQELAARIVDFGGWALPVNYGSQVDEHLAVRASCGIFDVSHMTVSDLSGAETINALSKLLANDIRKTSGLPGKALYSCMLNHDGGVLDDLIVYQLSGDHCRLITNASTNAKDMAWIQEHTSSFDVNFREKPELALIAIQGPEAIAKTKSLDQLFSHNDIEEIGRLERFQGVFLPDSQSYFVGRTGYTGEDGLEVVLPADSAQALWAALVEAGVPPCGLGARDTLRLEAGMALYGNDLDESHTPLESGVGWSVAMQNERDFIGRRALEKPANHKMIGLTLIDRGVLREHQTVFMGDQKIGEVTSGSFSPTLEKSIAMARINVQNSIKVGEELEIEIRNKRLRAQVCKYPFVKNGKPS